MLICSNFISGTLNPRPCFARLVDKTNASVCLENRIDTEKGQRGARSFSYRGWRPGGNGSPRGIGSPHRSGDYTPPATLTIEASSREGFYDFPAQTVREEPALAAACSR